jgi:hypothetical protein
MQIRQIDILLDKIKRTLTAYNRKAKEADKLIQYVESNLENVCLEVWFGDESLGYAKTNFGWGLTIMRGSTPHLLRKASRLERINAARHIPQLLAHILAEAEKLDWLVTNPDPPMPRRVQE